MWLILPNQKFIEVVKAELLSGVTCIYLSSESFGNVAVCVVLNDQLRLEMMGGHTQCTHVIRAEGAGADSAVCCLNDVY